MILCLLCDHLIKVPTYSVAKAWKKQKSVSFTPVVKQPFYTPHYNWQHLRWLVTRQGKLSEELEENKMGSGPEVRMVAHLCPYLNQNHI